ncbi:hypothetical protein GY45DRAFT_423677 [Cubamyces sp. BRFM 1775]|nr:hypothetical protein GY45DRAFT_423677 [Cubamyces sp. BRFM 1775]
MRILRLMGASFRTSELSSVRVPALREKRPRGGRRLRVVALLIPSGLNIQSRGRGPGSGRVLRFCPSKVGGRRMDTVGPGLGKQTQTGWPPGPGALGDPGLRANLPGVKRAACMRGFAAKTRGYQDTGTIISSKYRFTRECSCRLG